MLISEAFAQTAASATPAAANDPFGGMLGFMPIVLMFGVLYFLMIRPQQKKAKEHTKLVNELQKGDEIVTNGGLAGRITKVGENYMTISVSDVKDVPVEVIVQKSAVTTLLPKGTLKTL